MQNLAKSITILSVEINVKGGRKKVKTISRTVKITTIIACMVGYREGTLVEVTLPNLVTSEKVTDTFIQKFYKDKLEKGFNFVIKDRKEEEKEYSMTLDRFVKHCEIEAKELAKKIEEKRNKENKNEVK